MTTHKFSYCFDKILSDKDFIEQLIVPYFSLNKNCPKCENSTIVNQELFFSRDARKNIT